MSNTLAAMRPELIAEWSEKNHPLTPDKITYGSNKLVWWKGKCGHEWKTSVKARSNGEKCPICSGARVITGINDLSTLKSELAYEWSEKNDILAESVAARLRENGFRCRVVEISVRDNELFSFTHQKKMKVSYMVTGNRNYPVLPRVMMKCHHCGRVMTLKNFREGELLDKVEQDKYYI